jgi:serine/threonine-protein kinase
MPKEKISQDNLPELIGDYKVISRIGKGGMGDIYKARQDPLKRIVALKVLPPHLSRDDEFAKRFKIEAEAVSRLEHQNIVSIYEYVDDDFGDGEGYRFIAMQYVDGMDLGEYIRENKRIPIADIIDFTKQICRGLRYAHGHNIVHRDIKPQNILLDKDKDKTVIRITDFGIAKTVSTSITITGSTIGTPEYMSPEQAQGKKIDAQSDIYSLGIVMYELLIGKPPFIANNSMAVAYKQVHEIPSPPSLKRKDTPKLLELIILKALRKDKKDRYETIEELLIDLDKVDINDRIDRPTVQMHKAAAKVIKDEQPKPAYEIVDRRGGERRGTFGDDLPFFSKEYWFAMIKTQWLSWLAIAAVGGALAWHVMNR